MAAEDAAAPVPPASPFAQVLENIRNLSQRQKIAAGAALAFAIALVVGVILWSRQPDYAVLFSNLAEKDGGAVVASLQQQNVPYKFSDNGNAILVPTNQVHDLRLRMAAQGIPKGGLVGFELMENQKLGISQFHEQVNFQRALEGELSRTISAIASVAGARVHLAIPKPTVFVREELKPSASVLLNLYPGRSLEPSQIAGIQNLVAASVPSLAVASVTILDQSGAMLSQLKSKLMEAGLDPTQITYVREIEASAIKRIQDILAPIVGPENVHVQVAADVDFSQSEQTAETHRPNTTPPDISIRSQQTSESASTTPSALGVPGALSNQPPVPATAPLTQPAVPPATATAAGAATGQPLPGQLDAAGVQAPINSVAQPINTRKDSTINYEIDKTISHTKQAIGTIKRLSTAVVVNHRKDAKGLMKPLPDADLKQINDLVKEAMGYNKDRGDTLSVASSPFTASDKTEMDIPLWKDPDILALAKDLFKYGAIAAIIAYLMLKVVMPLIKTMATPPPPPKPAHVGTLGRSVARSILWKTVAMPQHRRRRKSSRRNSRRCANSRSRTRRSSPT